MLLHDKVSQEIASDAETIIANFHDVLLLGGLPVHVFHYTSEPYMNLTLLVITLCYICYIFSLDTRSYFVLGILDRTHGDRLFD
jgi:hypothetical protein